MLNFLKRKYKPKGEKECKDKAEGSNDNPGKANGVDESLIATVEDEEAKQKGLFPDPSSRLPGKQTEGTNAHHGKVPVPICKSPSNSSLKKSSASEGDTLGSRRSSNASTVSVSIEADKDLIRRKSSNSSVKWADQSDTDNDSHDGLVKMNSKALLRRDSFDEDVEESVPHHTVAYTIIPEEEETGDKNVIESTNVSSGETEEDCDGANDPEYERKPRVPRKPSKDRRRTFPKILFPGLRKDSIALYKDQFGHLSGLGLENEDTPPYTNDTVTGSGVSTEPASLPGGSILKRRSSKVRMNEEVKESLFTILSGMYAMFLIVLGAVLPIAEVFAEEKHPMLFEVFYLYMYGGSLGFLIYVYVYLLRSQGADTQTKRRRKRKVSVNKIGSHTGSFYLRLGAVAFGIGSMIHSGLQLGEYFQMENMTSCKHAIFALRPVVRLLFTFSQLYFVFMNSKMCINRYKTIARFGLMHMVATNICVWFNVIVVETLHQLHSLDYHVTETHDPQLDVPSSHDDTPRGFNFNITASHSDHSQGGQERHVLKNVTYLVNDSLHEIYSNIVSQVGSLNIALDTSAPETRTCDENGLMLNVLETAGPYLYPCSIEYSLICAGIVYTLWTNTGRRVMAIKSEDGVDEHDQLQRLSVDCSNSSRGLFTGILVLVGTIITMVVFFVLVNTPTYYSSATLVEYLSEITLYTMSTVAVAMAALQMRNLCFNSARETDFEEVLILVSLVGDYMFELLSILAALFNAEHFASRLNIATCLLGITQSTVQTIFVLISLRRSAKTPEQQRQKQGREFVTFLLISNIAMWCINTFEAQRTVANPVQMDYYGALAWNILIHISIPLGIFFRFHSTVCLSNVWKRAWKGPS